MKNTFDLRKFLTENRLTQNSKAINEIVYYSDEDEIETDGIEFDPEAERAARMDMEKEYPEELDELSDEENVEDEMDDFTAIPNEYTYNPEDEYLDKIDRDKQAELRLKGTVQEDVPDLDDMDAEPEDIEFVDSNEEDDEIDPEQEVDFEDLPDFNPDDYVGRGEETRDRKSRPADVDVDDDDLGDETDWEDSGEEGSEEGDGEEDLDLPGRDGKWAKAALKRALRVAQMEADEFGYKKLYLCWKDGHYFTSRLATGQVIANISAGQEPEVLIGNVNEEGRPHRNFPRTTSVNPKDSYGTDDEYTQEKDTTQKPDSMFLGPDMSGDEVYGRVVDIFERESRTGVPGETANKMKEVIHNFLDDLRQRYSFAKDSIADSSLDLTRDQKAMQKREIGIIDKNLEQIKKIQDTVDSIKQTEKNGRPDIKLMSYLTNSVLAFEKLGVGIAGVMARRPKKGITNKDNPGPIGPAPAGPVKNIPTGVSSKDIRENTMENKGNFDLAKFLVENKMTEISRRELLSEDHVKGKNYKYVVKKSKEDDGWCVWEGPKKVKHFKDKDKAIAYASKQNEKQDKK